MSARLARLDRLARVPAAVLAAIVRRDGACMYGTAEVEAGWQDERLTDQELAAELCGGCAVPGECLELEFREAGADTVGVWGGLPAEERRELYRHWRPRDESKGGPQA
jgi:WhiB family transcriptional regulator, redox-sensing transcriptional regulator